MLNLFSLTSTKTIRFIFIFPSLDPSRLFDFSRVKIPIVLSSNIRARISGTLEKYSVSVLTVAMKALNIKDLSRLRSIAKHKAKKFVVEYRQFSFSVWLSLRCRPNGLKKNSYDGRLEGMHVLYTCNRFVVELCSGLEALVLPESRQRISVTESSAKSFRTERYGTRRNKCSAHHAWGKSARSIRVTCGMC